MMASFTGEESGGKHRVLWVTRIAAFIASITAGQHIPTTEIFAV